MLTHLRPAIVLLVLFTVLCGIVYPLGITGIAQLAFSSQANGSLIEKDGKIVGSSLIGQNFTADKYFHSRPSATTTADPNDSTKTIPAPYNASNSSGSNLGPTSQSLIDGVKAAAETLHAESPQPIPVDMVTASGSGLDPDITPAAARFQIARVAKARRLSESQVADLVAKYTEPRQFGFLGEPLVNVLLLNLALDRVSTGS